MEGLEQELETVSSLGLALDSYYERLQKAACVTIVDELMRTLGEFYDAAAIHGELEHFRAECRSHPLHRLTLEDPFTERAFSKPRGYAGDAVMLDYIYRPRTLSLSDIGAAIHFITTGAGTAQSIIWRRDHLGAEISKTVKRTRKARILSVASGHLRELDVVRRVVDRRDFEIVALDHDRESLTEAVNSNPDFNISPVNKSISHLFKGEDPVKYDLIYSAGLFDYLSAETASSLASRLLDMLAPAGRLIVGNYAPEIYGRGYLEGMMGWTLLYRNEADLERLLDPIAFPDKRIYRDEPGNVVYLEMSSR